jgi:ectoine hydroxylase-related dioxygenase (phytanoyl-CoA dioxygenase family)
MAIQQPAARRNRFDLFGFEVFRGLLAHASPRVFADVEEAFGAEWGHHGSAERKAVPDFLERSPALTAAAAEAGLTEIASELLDQEAFFLYGDASEYRGDTYWHVDTRAAEARLVKFVFYDSPLDGTCGALRVLPGSHRAPGTRDAEPMDARDVPGHVLDVAPGDVIAFDPRIRHAALGGRVRRQVAVAYAARPQNPVAQQELVNLVLANRTVV